MRFFTIGLLLIITACSNTHEKTHEKQASDHWPTKMRATAQTFQDLLPYIYDEDKFSAPKNNKDIEKKIAAFSNSLHKIESKKARLLLGDDPYVLQSLSQLKEFTSRAKDYYSKGDFRHSRILLKATTNACFKCHTRVKYGPESYYWKNFDVSRLETSPLEKAHILVSMRQYDKAKTYIEEHLSELEGEGNFNLPYENAIKYYLMISLRGQNTLKSSKNFIQSKVLVNNVPSEFHTTLKQWLADINHWEKNKSELTPTLAGAQHVLKKNKKPNGEKNAVNDLIASSLLHKYLMNQKDLKNKAQAYYMLGNIYDSLILAGYWDLPEVYYEMCIKYAPKTKIAKQCYTRYRDNIVVGYSGSRGTIIPNYEYERLETLKEEAGIK